MNDITIKALWDNGNEEEWDYALENYYNILSDQQKPLEYYIDSINTDEIEQLSTNAFYQFLYDKYFVWKYTQKNRLATTRMNLAKYINNDEMAKLESIQKRLFSTPKDDIEKCLKIVCEIYGLGTAGASGLLAILFPAHFGTVDQFVVKRLREIQHPFYKFELERMNPDSLKIKDGVILVEIMREKAKELNQKFDTDFWTPRKIDMILWSFGR